MPEQSQTMFLVRTSTESIPLRAACRRRSGFKAFFREAKSAVCRNEYLVNENISRGGCGLRKCYTGSGCVLQEASVVRGKYKVITDSRNNKKHRTSWYVPLEREDFLVVYPISQQLD